MTRIGSREELAERLAKREESRRRDSEMVSFFNRSLGSRDIHLSYDSEGWSGAGNGAGFYIVGKKSLTVVGKAVGDFPNCRMEVWGRGEQYALKVFDAVQKFNDKYKTNMTFNMR